MPQDARQPEAGVPGKFQAFGLVCAAVVLSLAFLILLGRLFQHQVLDHGKYRARARAMHRSSEPICDYRGDIELGDGVLVARDVFGYELGLDPRYADADSLPACVRVVCDAMGYSAEYRRARMLVAVRAKKTDKVAYVHLADRVGQSTVSEIRDALEVVLRRDERRALVVRRRNWRTYPRGNLASSVIGVTNAAGVGIEGIEKWMEPQLAPRHGMREFLTDASHRRKFFRFEHSYLSPAATYSVRLTLDSRVQAIAEEALEFGVRDDRADSGLIVVMDCNRGDVLAMASYPTYDPNRFRDYPPPERERRRRNAVIENLYEPGSIIKPFVLAAALEQGLCREDELVKSYMPEQVTWDGGDLALFGSRRVRDEHEHEDMTVEDALVYSSNIGMAILGLKMGRDRLIDMLQRFGFCRSTGIGLPAEAKGKYTDPTAWKPLYSSVSVSFGYEVLLTPIQLCRAFAALVNGGYLLKPRIVDRLMRDGEEREFPEGEVVSRPISEQTSARMRGLMREVVQRGTGRFLKLDGFEFGGKTGTARLLQSGGYDRESYLASFEAFAPYEDPEVVILCMVERPRSKHYYGSWVAGPIVVEVIRKLFDVEAKPVIVKYKAR